MKTTSGGQEGRSRPCCSAATHVNSATLPARKSQSESVKKFLPGDSASGALTQIESNPAILLREAVRQAQFGRLLIAGPIGPTLRV